MTPKKDQTKQPQDLEPEENPTAGAPGSNVPITGSPNPNVPITGNPDPNVPITGAPGGQ